MGFDKIVDRQAHSDVSLIRGRLRVPRLIMLREQARGLDGAVYRPFKDCRWSDRRTVVGDPYRLKQERHPCIGSYRGIGGRRDSCGGSQFDPVGTAGSQALRHGENTADQ